MKKPLEYDLYNFPRDYETLMKIFGRLDFRDPEWHALTSMADFQTLVRGYCQQGQQASHQATKVIG